MIQKNKKQIQSGYYCVHCYMPSSKWNGFPRVGFKVAQAHLSYSWIMKLAYIGEKVSYRSVRWSQTEASSRLRIPLWDRSGMWELIKARAEKTQQAYKANSDHFNSSRREVDCNGRRRYPTASRRKRLLLGQPQDSSFITGKPAYWNK